MPDLAERVDIAGLDLDSAVMCCRDQCQQPAAARVKLHLRVRWQYPALGCRTVTLFFCAACVEHTLARVAASLPYPCPCQRWCSQPSDVVLWIRSLR